MNFISTVCRIVKHIYTGHKTELTTFSPASVSARSDSLIDLNAFIRDARVNFGLARFFHATNTAAKQWLSPSELFLLVSWMNGLLNPSSRANSCHLFLSQSSTTTVLARSAKSSSSPSLESSLLSAWPKIYHSMCMNLFQFCIHKFALYS